MSKNALWSSWTFRPTPEQPGHMPAGSLKPKALRLPTCGTLRRENSSRSSGLMSVTVLSVEREPPPRRLVDDDGGGQVLGQIGVGLAEPGQELPHERRERLVELALGLRGDGVEHQR